MSEPDDPGRGETSPGEDRTDASPLARLERLLSASIDGELDPAEREELASLVAERPEAEARRARLEAVDALLREVAADAAPPADPEVALAELRERVARRGPGVPGGARRRGPRRAAVWAPALVAAAAAALVIYWTRSASSPPAPEPERAEGGFAARPSGAEGPSGVALDPSGEGADAPLDDPLALAWVLGIAEDSEATQGLEGLSNEDLEIIEQLELMEYLAARDVGGRG